MRFLVSAIAVLALFDSVVFASPHASDSFLKKRHLGRSPSVPSLEGNHNTSSLEKRVDNVRFSFFDPGLGACGGYSTNRDFIVALNTPQWDGGSHCGKTITIRYKGKSTQATIVDRCVECPYGALDFSRGLFDFFGSQDDGYLWGSWDFGSGAPPKPETTSHKPKPTPTPTPTPKPEPTTTKEVPTTSSTSKTKTSSKHSSTASTTSTSATTTGSATPTETAVPAPPDSFLYQLNLALMGLAGIAAAAAQE
ncbi:RlpA-like double-psi beta-barrel-protein domain-containing protein-containing protein [Collybia nuda]|uniref:RlpA-like double-psi beta-barrel-protein domain-containing protein-containing protein n=1 Tax=Collybia nuda TaxID=64659 RepID=A0A9P5YCT2_9AGAR|nr:RlpA-like double-psi beta-barrel-protein domain-containing protein-containing protein [Collybia nuda]